MSRLKEFIFGNVDCSEFLLFAYAIRLNADSSIWVDIPVKFQYGSSSVKPLDSQRSRCLTEITKLLDVKQLPHSEHRSSKAVHHVWW